MRGEPVARGPAPGVLYSTHPSAKHLGGMGRSQVCVSAHLPRAELRGDGHGPAGDASGM